MPPDPAAASGQAPARPERLTLIAAMARGRVIGRNNRLPWRLPADLAHFKRLTLDKPIIMGRRTWESLPGLLPRRRHIVISRDPDFRAEGCDRVTSPESALDAAGAVPEAMIVGGAQIYAAFLERATTLALTLVDADVQGDAWFPAWDQTAWREVERSHRPPDAKNAFALDFVRLERRQR
jgi:dihydrofolate reductase